MTTPAYGNLHGLSCLCWVPPLQETLAGPITHVRNLKNDIDIYCTTVPEGNTVINASCWRRNLGAEWQKHHRSVIMCSSLGQRVPSESNL